MKDSKEKKQWVKPELRIDSIETIEGGNVPTASENGTFHT
jgi:hypothetical protein